MNAEYDFGFCKVTYDTICINVNGEWQTVNVIHNELSRRYV